MISSEVWRPVLALNFGGGPDLILIYVNDKSAQRCNWSGGAGISDLESRLMKIAVAMLLAMALAFISPQPSFANCGNDKPVGEGCEVKAAPAPLIGLGLPGMAIGVGFGAYWLVRRWRKVS